MRTIIAIVTTIIFLLSSLHPSDSTSTGNRSTRSNSILIFGSSNLDTFLPLKRLPTEGENLTLLPNTSPIIDVPGGKGCNQAIACSKLAKRETTCTTNTTPPSSYFVSRIGDVTIDEATLKLIKVLEENGVNIEFTKQCEDIESGRGYVFLEKETGKVSAVVSGGSNLSGWSDFSTQGKNDVKEYIQKIIDVSNPSCLLLQREIPEFVNEMVVKCIREQEESSDDDNDDDHVIIIQDVGGEDRPISKEMLSLCDYIIPNESELKRLCQSVMTDEEFEATKQDLESSMGEDNHSYIVKLATILQDHGANHVLVTLGAKGSILVKKKRTEKAKHEEEDGILYHEACSLNCPIVDETGAGDCFRAGFAVALSERKPIEKCVEFASASGALAVTKEGAVPSVPSREEVEELLALNQEQVSKTVNVARGGGMDSKKAASDDDSTFPFMFGSRLNSMKDRPELWPKPVDNVREWVKRQATIDGLGCVDFNWPQHFQTWDPNEAKEALNEVGLVAGSVCLRYPSKFARGAMIHPDPKLRREAIELTKQAADVARQLGCNEVVVWSACK